ncbi:MAG: hypothetical protein ACYC35_05250 [Pirellulales bacterium]
MRTLSEQECQEWLTAHLGRIATRQNLEREYANCVTYRLPIDTGKKTALARILSRSIDTSQFGMFWITGWGIFPSSENMALFDGYRRSLGENRVLSAACGHVFGESDLQQLECLLDLALYFYWDSSLFDGAGSIVVSTSHDEYLSVYTQDKARLRQFQDRLEPLKLKEVGSP